MVTVTNQVNVEVECSTLIYSLSYLHGLFWSPRFGKTKMI